MATSTWVSEQVVIEYNDIVEMEMCKECMSHILECKIEDIVIDAVVLDIGVYRYKMSMPSRVPDTEERLQRLRDVCKYHFPSGCRFGAIACASPRKTMRGVFSQF